MIELKIIIFLFIVNYFIHVNSYYKWNQKYLFCSNDIVDIYSKVTILSDGFSRRSLSAPDNTDLLKHLKRLSNQNFSSISREQKLILLQNISARSIEMTSTDIVNCLMHLSHLGLDIQDLENKALIQQILSSYLLSEFSNLDTIRMFSTLDRLSLSWVEIPGQLQRQYLTLLEDSQVAIGDSPLMIWTLGRLRTRFIDLPRSSRLAILDRLIIISSKLSPQGLSMCMNGLSKLNAIWDTDLPLTLRTQLMERIVSLGPSLKTEEICSILTALAVMQAQPAGLPKSLAATLNAQLANRVEDLDGRELSNVLWSLGQFAVRETGESEDGSAVTSNDVIAILMRRVPNVTDEFTRFDMESVLTGLANVKVHGERAREVLRAVTNRLLLQLSPDYSPVGEPGGPPNGFFVANILRAFVQLQIRTSTSLDSEPWKLHEDTIARMSPELERAVFSATLTALHSFPEKQQAFVLSCLACLGYHRSLMTDAQARRITAVLSRVLFAVSPYDFSVLLLALAHLGLDWANDLAPASPGQISGRTVEPLAGRILNYFKRKIGDFRESDLATAIFGLGHIPSVNIDSEENGEIVKRKIYNRWSKLVRFSNLSSMAQFTSGLGRIGAKWNDLPLNTTQAWITALPTIFNAAHDRTRDEDHMHGRLLLGGLAELHFFRCVEDASILTTSAHRLLRTLTSSPRVPLEELEGVAQIEDIWRRELRDSETRWLSMCQRDILGRYLSTSPGYIR